MKTCLMKEKRTELEQFFLITESYFIDEIANTGSREWKISDESRLRRIARGMREIAGLEEL